MRTDRGYRRLVRHLDEPGHAHYFTFSCFHNQSFLTSPRACAWLVESILDAKAKHPFDLWAWVFMPEHVHLLVRPARGVKVGTILKTIKEPVSKRVAAWVRCNAPEFAPKMLDVQPSGRQTLRFWQPGGGYDRNIFSVQELHEKIDYIHKNPLRRNLVSHPEDWIWSSFHAWSSGEDRPLPIDRSTLAARG
jgi:putative transposase